jgi:hypothetical protein
MSELHLLITRRAEGFWLELTHGADRGPLAHSPSVEDVRAAARAISAWTVDEHTGRHIPILDKSGVE